MAGSPALFIVTYERGYAAYAGVDSQFARGKAEPALGVYRPVTNAGWLQWSPNKPLITIAITTGDIVSPWCRISFGDHCDFCYEDMFVSYVIIPGEVG